MVLKPGRLPPNKKTIEEVVLTRKITTAHHGARSQTSPQRAVPRHKTRPIQSAAPVTLTPTCLLHPDEMESTSQDVKHLAQHLNRLNERLHDLEVANHQHIIMTDPLAEDLVQVTHIHPPVRDDPDPKLSAKVTHTVKEVHSIVHRLDRVFFDITSAENKRNHAATMVAAIVRGYLARRRHAAAMSFLGTWRFRHTKTFLDCVLRFSLRAYRVDRGVDEMLERSRLRRLRKSMEEMRDVTLLQRPTRRVQTQAVELRFQKKMRIVLGEMFGSWKAVAIGPRSRKRMIEAYRARLYLCRARLESLLRYDVITPEMVQMELQKQNTRMIREKSVHFRQKMYFRLLVTHVFRPMRANLAKSLAHFRGKTINRVGAAWVQHFRTFQIERELQKVNDRRTFDRFPQYYNIRRIDYHYKRTTQRKHFRAWILLHRRSKQVQIRFEKAALRMLLQMIRAWRIRAAYQHRLREAAIREWNAYCIRIFKVPFQSWVLYILQRKHRHTTQEGLIRAFHRRQHRHTTYSFFRIWKHQTLFGHVEGIHSRVQLIKTLEQQKAYCLSLEENAVSYQKVIESLRGALGEEKQRLEAKESELEALHKETQATRFAMHNAEQQVARSHSLLNAVRDIHPGTIKRIERMYSEDSILAGELKDVIHLHIMRVANEQHVALQQQENEIMDKHMLVDAHDDQLLLRRVKWVLSRLHLNYNQVTDNMMATKRDIEAMAMQMNQMYALYEFMRSGDTSALIEENIPLSKEPHVLNESLHVPQDKNELIEVPELIATDDKWNKFVQDVAERFPPKRFVPIQDRIVSYALNRVEEKRVAQWEDQKPTIYSRVHHAQLKDEAQK